MTTTTQVSGVTENETADVGTNASEVAHEATHKAREIGNASDGITTRRGAQNGGTEDAGTAHGSGKDHSSKDGVVDAELPPRWVRIAVVLTITLSL